MSIENIYFIAQIIAALAIIGTLAYGIFQIRANNALVRAELTHSLGKGLQVFFYDMGADAEVSRIWRLGCKGSGELTAEEKVRFGLLCRSAFIGNEMHHSLHNSGLIDQHMYDRLLVEIKDMVNMPGVRTWWNKGRTYCHADFAEIVDDMIDDKSTDD